MNPRERIIAAIEHRQPDRVPIDIGATPSTNLSAIAYGKLARHLGISQSRTQVYDVVQELAQPEQWFLDRFNVDVVDNGRMFNQDGDYWYPITLSDGSQAYYPKSFRPQKQEDGSLIACDETGRQLAKKPVGATFFDQTYFPYIDGYPPNYSNLGRDMQNVMWAKFTVAPWDKAGEENFWENLREKTKKLHEETDYAIMIGAGCNLFEWGTFLRRMDNFMMDVYADPDNAKRLLDALVETHMQNLEKICKYVGDLCDVIRFGDDLGMDSGPFMAPEIYADMFMPRHKLMIDYVKANSRMKPYLHSCGSIYQLLPHLIEAGFEVVNPVQTTARDMEPERLKKEFGSDICFWGGGADTRHVLNRKGPEEVREDVLRRLEVFAPGGGYVFNTIHNIMPEVPPENILALFDAVEEYNRNHKA